MQHGHLIYIGLPTFLVNAILQINLKGMDLLVLLERDWSIVVRLCTINKLTQNWTLHLEYDSTLFWSLMWFKWYIVFGQILHDRLVRCSIENSPLNFRVLYTFLSFKMLNKIKNVKGNRERIFEIKFWNISRCKKVINTHPRENRIMGFKVSFNI